MFIVVYRWNPFPDEVRDKMQAATAGAAPRFYPRDGFNGTANPSQFLIAYAYAFRVTDKVVKVKADPPGPL
jgi:hypothetical protein